MEPDTSEREDAYFDEQVGMVVTRAGKARWRQRLNEHRESRDVDALDALKAQLRLGPAAQA